MALAGAKAWASAWRHRLLLHRGSLQHQHHHHLCQLMMIRRSASVEDTCWDLAGLHMFGRQCRLDSERNNYKINKNNKNRNPYVLFSVLYYFVKSSRLDKQKTSFSRNGVKRGNSVRLETLQLSKENFHDTLLQRLSVENDYMIYPIYYRKFYEASASYVCIYCYKLPKALFHITHYIIHYMVYKHIYIPNFIFFLSFVL